MKIFIIFENYIFTIKNNIDTKNKNIITNMFHKLYISLFDTNNLISDINYTNNCFNNVLCIIDKHIIKKLYDIINIYMCKSNIDYHINKFISNEKNL